MPMGEVIPLYDFNCFRCGAGVIEICIYTCKVNGHLGSVVVCQKCLDEVRHLDLELTGGDEDDDSCGNR